MLDQITKIVREAGEIALSARDIEGHTHRKTSAADLVTDYDMAVEAFLKRKLGELLPQALFYGEEEAANGDPTHGWAFIVDPIDGTANFVRGFHHSAVSVALLEDSTVRYGVVLDPFKDELFTAEQGKGAFLNGKPITVSGRPLEEGVFGMGTSSYRRECLGPTMALTEQLMRRSCDFRRIGTASLDLCYVACGRTELFFEYSLCPWDYAAGALLVTEAGGSISTLRGEPLRFDRRQSVWACNAVNRNVLSQLTVPWPEEAAADRP